ncbi:hypothetical protein AAG747_03105 [Rapidithrix thailandica]|uniref:Uncharacterized protein n=1 Tax=Rapidithrix thailandica TaxID=413964 RepID=A0AAW9RPQ8_9BACT
MEELRPDLSPIHQYAQKFANIICDNFFKSQPFIHGKEIVNLTHIKQVNLFIVKNIFEEWLKEAKKIHSPFFDYTAPEVKQTINLLMSKLSQHIRIKRIHFEPLLQEAIADTMLLQFYPQDFFEKLFLEYPKNISTSKHILPLRKYIALHETVTEAVFSKFRDLDESIKRKRAAKIATMVVDEQQQQLEKPYDLIQQFSEVLPVGIYELVPDYKDIQEQEEEEPEGNFLDFDEVPHFTMDEMVSKENEERQKLFELERLQNEEDNLDKEFDQIYETSNRFRKESEIKGQDPEEEAIPQKSAAPKEEETSNSPDLYSIEYEGSLRKETRHNLKPGDIPEEDSPQGNDYSGTEQSTVLDQLHQKDSPSTTPDNQKLFAHEEEEEEASTHSPLLAKLGNQQTQSIKDIISLNQRFKFQNELFNGNSEEFNIALERIDQCGDYHKAITIIKENYLRPNNWDFEADATKEFLSLISVRFQD